MTTNSPSIELKERRRSSTSKELRALVQAEIAALGLSPILTFLQIYKEKRVGFFRLLPDTMSEGFSKVFEDSVVGDASLKSILKADVARHSYVVGQQYTWQLCIAQLLTVVRYLMLFVLWMRFVAWLKTSSFPLPTLPGQILRNAVSLLLLLFLPAFILQIVGQYLPRRSAGGPNISHYERLGLIVKITRWWPITLGVVLLVWWMVLKVYSLYNALTVQQQGAYTALTFVLIVIVAFRLVSLIEHAIYYALNRERSHCADSQIVVQLLALVGMLGNRAQISQSFRRRASIALLEGVSQLFEHSLPRQIVGNDPNSSSLTQQLAKIGNGVRALKKRVAIPRSTSWDEELLKSVSEFLLNFLSLNWAALPTVDKKDMPRRTLISRVKAGTQWLIAASMPAILFGVLQLTPLRLSGPRAEVVLVVTLAWFALSVLLRVDPEFSAKTKTLKEVQDITTFGMKL